MSNFLKSIAEAEMEDYDALPKAIREVFSCCPRNVCVAHTMSLPDVKKAYQTMPLTDFSEFLRKHLRQKVEE